ncbi:FAD-dependent monooxygenase [Herbidospora galbida]|uniref:FAD-dependent monooxygenase n=1 Tax=Herbidospora galbida TaxID=2575442 RepID=A0A4U3M7S3_9ACTN|nr:NAD(P)/FAD-dependent oxidoreductase [Herbidospora galbida]TKK84259.1 FAD-dependent monooxygenase [Herbidospora galbida]
MRIAIVGAGLGGVTAATGLHLTGHDVTLYERAPDLRETGTGIVVMPNGLAALDTLGLGAPLRAHAAPTAQGGLRDRAGRPLLVTDAAKAQERYGPTVVVDRAVLHRTLREGLPADRVRTGVPVDDLNQEPGGVTLLSGGEEIATAEAVVVADGIGSRLRARLFPGHPGAVRTGRLDLRGTLGPIPGVHDLLTAILVDRHSGAMFGLFPMGAGGLYWFTDAPAPATVPAPEQARDQMAELMAGWHPAVPAVLRATAVADVHVDPITRLARPLETYTTGRICLLGDAAHGMTPDLGQGASQAFEDAAALVRHLTGAAPGEAAERLARYDAQRRPRANRLMAASSRQSRLTTRTGPAAWLRDALLRATPPALAARQLAAIWLP